MTDEMKDTPITATEIQMRNLLAPLHRQIESLEMAIVNQEAPPAKCDKVFAALAKAQAEIKNAEHDAEADAGQYKYQYATLDAVLNAVRGPLSANGLSITQLPGRKVEKEGVELLTLTTVLGHSSGQFIDNDFEMYPPKRDPQGIGSAMTYMRRYVIMAMCGIAGAADDDAEKTKPEAEKITAAQADQIFNLADELFGADSEALLQRMCDKIFGIERVVDIPAAEFEVAIQRIENTRKRKDREAAEAKAAKKPKDEGGEKKPPAKPASDDVPVA